jgi:hypothetical protein
MIGGAWLTWMWLRDVGGRDTSQTGRAAFSAFWFIFIPLTTLHALVVLLRDANPKR